MREWGLAYKRVHTAWNCVYDTLVKSVNNVLTCPKKTEDIDRWTTSAVLLSFEDFLHGWKCLSRRWYYFLSRDGAGSKWLSVHRVYILEDPWHTTLRHRVPSAYCIVVEQMLCIQCSYSLSSQVLYCWQWCINVFPINAKINHQTIYRHLHNLAQYILTLAKSLEIIVLSCYSIFRANLNVYMGVCNTIWISSNTISTYSNFHNRSKVYYNASMLQLERHINLYSMWSNTVWT